MVTDKQPRKKWASAKERKAFYSQQYQRKMMDDTGEAGERYRAARRAVDAKRRDKNRSDPERIRKLAERIAKDNASKRAKAAVKAEVGRLESASRSLSDKLKATDAMASRTIVAPQRQSVEEFMAAGGSVEVIPSQIGHAYSGLRPYRLALV